MRCVVRPRALQGAAAVAVALRWGPRWCSATTKTAAPPPPPPPPSAAAGVLPGVDLARRAVSPSQEFPATWSEDEPLAPSDPRVLWREHYSLDQEKPYYQNVKTMEVTWQIPEGFVTRFPRLYEANGYRVDAKGAVFRAAGDAAVQESAPASGEAATGVKDMTLKQRLAAYGAGGLLWYLIVHTVSLFGVFACLYVFRIDLIGIARSYGFDVKRSSDMQLSENHRPPLWKTFLVSIILNKMMVPLHLLVTVFTAPLLVHRLEPIAAAVLPRMRAFAQDFMKKALTQREAPKA